MISKQKESYVKPKYFMKYTMFKLLLLLAVFPVLAQSGVKGTVIDAITTETLPQVQVSIEGTNFGAETNALGEFMLTENLSFGEQILIVRKNGYLVRRLPIVLQEGQLLDLEKITLEIDVSAEQRTIGLISLSDNEVSGDDDDSSSYNVSGLLSAGRDAFLNAAAFDFSATFFRPRGLDNANGKLLINGIEMNKQFNGRPQWGNWGGINDVQRNREFSMGLSPNEYSFGGVAGTTNIIMRASQERQGGRISYAAANRSYNGRVMASYSSGLMANGWAYTVLGSRRFGEEGYQGGTLYDANSFSASVEKKLSDDHSLNFTAFYTPNRRGRSTAITQEVFELKGRKYNPFWGNQDGEIRNSRIREIQEPIIMLNHFWNISEKTSLNSNIGYQFGTIKNSRIDNGRLRNPSPEYYQSLPSFFLQDDNPTANDFANAYQAQQLFINDGQLDWNNLYQSNVNSVDGISRIILQNDVIEDSQLSANVILSSQLTENITFNGNVSFRDLSSENYAEVRDLLGGQGFLDIDNFSVSESQDGAQGSLPQSDLQNPNRVVKEGDRYKYNYEVDASVVSGFAQAVFKYNKVDFHLATNLSQTSYQRNGLYENGNYQGSASLGKSEKLDFSNYGVKGGMTYKVTGRHIIDLNGGYYTQAPGIRSSFSNARQNNDVVSGLESEQIQSVDASYIFRSPIVKARLTGYYTNFSKGTDIGFYFVEDLATLGSEDGNAFVQEVMTNVERRNLGMELGFEAQVTPTIKLKAAASIGQNIYTNNPDLYLTSDDFAGEELRFGDGTTNLENVHVAGGPERAFQVGFEYRDPNFWWIGATTNYFSNAYSDISNLARSGNFVLDSDGLPFNDYDPEIAAGLLKQEEFDDYVLVNIVGGKSWKIDDYFIGFFATVNNVLDQEYKTGGFEQSRTANYRNLKEDKSRENGPVFGPRYFFGNGTTYYVNAYIRF
tara:strand:- start:2840 stop:5683 length:2844 start_codon:yes stop_codon:yes gene_type:complete